MRMEKSVRSMIIVWSWNKSGYGEQVWQLDSQQHSEDRIICIDQLADDTAIDRLGQLIQAHSGPKQAVMLFMHRHHGYKQEHIQQLMAMQPADQLANLKCFLFGEGAENIYLKNEARALLGRSGCFETDISDADGNKQSLSAIQSFENKTIKTTHFNYTWSIYQHALRKRIFELKEELIATCFEQQSSAPVFEAGTAYALLNQAEHKLLFLRLLSFIGKIRKRSSLAIDIRTLEREHNKAFAFENCALLIASSYGSEAEAQYQVLAKYIYQHALTKKGSLDLLALRQEFDKLLAYFD